MTIQQEMQMLQNAACFLNFSEIIHVAAQSANKIVSWMWVILVPDILQTSLFSVTL